MLEQLVESKSNSKENKTLGGFIATTFFIVACVCFSAVLTSLFAMNLGMGGEDLEMTSLVAPIEVEVKPEPVKEIKKEIKQAENTADETTRQTNILAIDENPIVPKEISVVPNTQKERPKGAFKISEGLEVDAAQPQGANRTQTNDGSETGVMPAAQPKVVEEKENEEAPQLKKKVEKVEVVEVKTPKPPVSRGVLNGQALSLPKPTVSAAAKLVKAGGEVVVQVTIDEQGSVISAKAVSGHTLLRAESEKAARGARFTPTKLSGEPVKVTGLITYRFAQ